MPGRSCWGHTSQHLKESHGWCSVVQGCAPNHLTSDTLLPQQPLQGSRLWKRHGSAPAGKEPRGCSLTPPPWRDAEENQKEKAKLMSWDTNRLTEQQSYHSAVSMKTTQTQVRDTPWPGLTQWTVWAFAEATAGLLCSPWHAALGPPASHS